MSWEPRYIMTVTSHEFTEALQLYRNKEKCTVEEDSIIRSHDLSRASSFRPIFLSAARRMQVSAVNNGPAMHLHICINKTDSLICMLSAFIFFI